jgi:uncharacterized membrane protein
VSNDIRRGHLTTEFWAAAGVALVGLLLVVLGVVLLFLALEVERLVAGVAVLGAGTVLLSSSARHYVEGRQAVKASAVAPRHVISPGRGL